MARIGIRTIGFIEKSAIDDQWNIVQPEEPQERGVPSTPIDNIQRFKSIDQSATSLTEELVSDEQGRKYSQHLKTVVRTDHDINLAENYAGRSVVMHVWTVTGKHITIGTGQYPTFMVTSNRNTGVETREVEINVDYETLTSIL